MRPLSATSRKKELLTFYSLMVPFISVTGGKWQVNQPTGRGL